MQLNMFRKSTFTLVGSTAVFAGKHLTTNRRRLVLNTNFRHGWWEACRAGRFLARDLLSLTRWRGEMKHAVTSESVGDRERCCWRVELFVIWQNAGELATLCGEQLREQLGIRSSYTYANWLPPATCTLLFSSGDRV